MLALEIGEIEMNLYEMKCGACRRDTPLLSGEEITEHLANLPGWRLNGIRTTRMFECLSFDRAHEFLNKVAEIAKAQDHHPVSLNLGEYSTVTVSFTTRVSRGLTKNDFIMAAKVDQLYKEMW